MTAAQRRRAQQIIDIIEERTRESWQIALATPVMEASELSALCRTDRSAAAAFLAGLDQRQLWVEAIACASWMNEHCGHNAGAGVQAEDLYTQFQAIIAKAAALDLNQCVSA